MDTTIANKLTLKVICGMGRDKTTEETKAYFKKLAEAKTEIAAIVGEITGYGGKTSQFGESFFLIGDFYAQNRQTGEIFEGNKIYLPKDITETLKAAFDKRADIDAAVKIHLTVTVILDSGSATGYVYVCRPIKNPLAINKRAEMLAEFKMLPAPEVATKKTANK